MAIDISGIFLFMPIFSFLFVFLVVYAILSKSQLLGEGMIPVFVSFIMAIIFISFSSLELYVQTIVPWFVVLLICTFLVLLIAGFSSKNMDWILKPGFGWTVIVILLVIFLVAAIKVFNPVFHPDLLLTSGQGTSLLEQISYGTDGRIFGTILLLGIVGAVSWWITKK
ncbi:hypothetical protein CMI42_04315 [Candidatus Pacearchaeota archaeon]|nr:hypothetical protein [Candidatus Pacearchaeota archaeon]|tara:strand:- start:36 stop:539 length:504 start_codon:yes stop_codon:yes gene_type:complete